MFDGEISIILMYSTQY